MIEYLNNLVLAIADPLLAWVLYLPRDVGLFLVAVATSAILVLVRKRTTDQDWLKRADHDKSLLDGLIRKAKRRKDKEAVQRHKLTVAQIQMGSLKFELKPLLWALLPILLLATWCFSRLGFEAPQAGETVPVIMRLPNSGVGRVAHIAPQDGLKSANGWAQTVVQETPIPPANLWERGNQWLTEKLGMAPELETAAVWQLTGEPRKEPYVMTFWYDGKAYTKAIAFGQKRYAPDLEIYPETPVRSIQVLMRPRMLFGLVGGLDFLIFPPWLVAYLLITIPFVTILKRALRIY